MSDAPSGDDVGGTASNPEAGQTPAESLLEQRKTGAGGSSDVTGYAVAALLGGATGFLIAYILVSLTEIVYVTVTDSIIGFTGMAPRGVLGIGVLIGVIAGVKIGKRRSNRYLLYPFSLAVAFWLSIWVSDFLFSMFVPNDSRVIREYGLYGYLVMVPLIGIVVLKVWDELYQFRVSTALSLFPETDREIGSRVSRRAAVGSVGGAVATIVGLNVVHRTIGANEGDAVETPGELEASIINHREKTNTYQPNEYLVRFSFENVSGSSLSSVTAEATFYDGDGSQVATQSETYHGIEAGTKERETLTVQDYGGRMVGMTSRIESVVLEFSAEQ